MAGQNKVQPMAEQIAIQPMVKHCAVQTTKRPVTVGQWQNRKHAVQPVLGQKNAATQLGH